MKKRELSIDILRVIGIFLIILAHVNPPNFLFQLRNFDVTLMVVISAISFVMSNKEIRNKKEYFDYVKKRFKRLIIPTWIFFTLFFVVYFLVSLIFGIEFPFDFGTVISAYTLFYGVGYTWIIGILFVCACFYPLIIMLYKKQTAKSALIVSFGLIISTLLLCFIPITLTARESFFSLYNIELFWIVIILFVLLLICISLYFLKSKLSENVSFYLVVISMYVLYEFLTCISFNHVTINLIYSRIVTRCIAWLIVSLIIFKFIEYSKRTKFLFSGVMFIIFAACAIKFNFFNSQGIQGFKYPHQLFYLSYGMFVTTLLYNILNLIPFNENNVIDFISKNSFNIYFFHIAFTLFFDETICNIFDIKFIIANTSAEEVIYTDYTYIIVYILNLTFSIVSTIIFVKIKGLINLKYSSYKDNKKIDASKKEENSLELQ